MRDAEYAAKLRKTNTKSSRRRDTRFLNPTQVNMRLQILADQGVNVDWDAIDDPTVHFNHLCQEPTAPAYPRFIAKFMDVCRVPIGERFVVDLLSYEEKEGVFACHWGKIRESDIQILSLFSLAIFWDAFGFLVFYEFHPVVNHIAWAQDQLKSFPFKTIPV